MGTPLRISDELVAEAKLVGDVLDRSATSQVEHWARLGRAIETVLGLTQVLQLKRAGAAVSIEAALASSMGANAQASARKHLESLGSAQYMADPERPGTIVRIAPDGRRTSGRFVKRTFVPDEVNTK